LSFQTDSRLETTFTPEIKTILADLFIQKHVFADLNEATDFAIFTVKPFRVGVRLRRYEFFNDYRHQFTIRWSRPSGVETEIHKIRKGYVTHYLYGFVNKSETRIIFYRIFDLSKFGNPTPSTIFENKDPPDSKFAVFNVKDFPKEFLIVTHDETELENHKLAEWT
jgi:hypothetical protein